MRRVGIALALLALLACASSPPKGQPPRRSVLLTEHDDAVVGRETAQDVKAEVGVLEDSELTAYVDGIGRKLLRGLSRRSFGYQFYVVDMPEPNAFALPGGYIFVSRGLLALANDEDELACVIGHEIIHSARRHAAASQALMQRQFPLAMAQARFATLASYSREMEREADEGGQILCAAAGYDPMAMSTFLTSLGAAERLTQGYSRGPSFFDTHPGTVERAASNAVRSHEIRWKRDPALGDPRAALLHHTDGMAVGQRPEAGMFEGDRFLHPVLGFSLRFPSGWKQSNSNRAVGAMAPRGDAIIYLAGDAPAGPADQVADAWVAREQEQTRLEVTDASPLKIAGIDAWRIEASARGASGTVLANITFIPFHDATYRITGAAPSMVASRYQAVMRNTARSFRALSDAELRALVVTRLRVAEARPGETLAAIGTRAGSAWSVQEMAVYNGVFVDHRFAGGELVKVLRSEPYAPAKSTKR
jgi:predicted Zn-dependent protease